MKRFKIQASSFQFLVRAYQSLKYWFDPAMEGSPYMPETEKLASNDTKRSFVPMKRMGWR